MRTGAVLGATAKTILADKDMPTVGADGRQTFDERRQASQLPELLLLPSPLALSVKQNTGRLPSGNRLAEMSTEALSASATGLWAKLNNNRATAQRMLSPVCHL